MPKLLAFACLALASATSVHAQSTEPAPPATPDSAPQPARPRAAKPGAPVPQVQQVQVSGTRANDTDVRRNATASKMIFGREELDRNGDSSVGEILKRLPGVTMGGPPGRGGGGGARMRGLGNGYTQMLVNGERPPAGFSLESLAPEQVERIEIMRGPVAEHSTQAIAGTINIVLREGYQQKDISLKLTDSIEQGLHSPNLSLTAPGKRGAFTWLLNGSLGVNRNRDANDAIFQEIKADGSVARDQLRVAESDSTSRMLHFSPRLSYRFENGDTLNFQPFMVATSSRGTSSSTLDQRVGQTPPEYALAQGTSESSAAFMRGFGNWLHKIDASAKIDVKFGFGGGRTSSESQRRQYAASGNLSDDYTSGDSSRNYGLNSGGKYTKSMGQGHLLAAGWDAEAGRRTQNTVAVRNGLPQFAESGADLSADTRRLAGYLQDEWDITPQWGVYLGLRWEGIRTNASNQGRETSSSTSVWSPVLHTVWRIPGHDKDQVRASLTQSYRAPQLNDLIAAPTFSQINDATRPDRSGNPDLKPELAKGLDLAYEHYIGKSGILSASGFVRQIDNLMRRKLTERMTDQGMRWLSTPSNVGSARTSGIELEAKFQLADLMADAPNLDLRANYSHFWSSVDGIPGPDNRLDQQAAQTANVGLDYRMKKTPLSLGGSYNWTPATVVQTSATERVSSGVKRQLDAYALWKFSPATQLRLSGNNLLHANYDSGASVLANSLTQMSQTATHTYTTVSLKLEMKL
jgi:outer membrane receptor for ferrienterochelin and colicins